MSSILETCKVKEFDNFKLFVKSKKNHIPACKLFPYELVHEQIKFIALSKDVEYTLNDEEKSNDEWNFWFSNIMCNSLPESDYVAVKESVQSPIMSVSSKEYKKFQCWANLLHIVFFSNSFFID